MPDLAASSFKDRSTRLTLFGVLALVVGGGWMLAGLLQLVLWLFAGSLPGFESLPRDLATYVPGIFLYGLIGVAFVWIGVGSIRRRRWVRSLMLILAWTWLLGGLISLPLAWSMIDDMLPTAAAGPELGPDVRVLARTIVLGIVGLLGILLPGIFVLAYQDRHVSRTCEAHDPTPAWTERCPTSVLGLSVGLGAFALVLLPMMVRPAVPLFGTVATGLPGALLTLVGAAVCGLLAYWTYRCRPAGWWGSTLLMLLVGVSTLWTLLRVGAAELYRAMGYAELGPGTNGTVLAWVTAIVTLLSLVYMATIRKHFTTEPV